MRWSRSCLPRWLSVWIVGHMLILVLDAAAILASGGVGIFLALYGTAVTPTVARSCTCSACSMPCCFPRLSSTCSGTRTSSWTNTGTRS